MGTESEGCHKTEALGSKTQLQGAETKSKHKKIVGGEWSSRLHN